jgi:hypothetical protein
VLFPEPVSPATTTTWWSRIVASSSSWRSVTGRDSGYAIAGTAARRRSTVRSVAATRGGDVGQRGGALGVVEALDASEPAAETVLVAQREPGQPDREIVGGIEQGFHGIAHRRRPGKGPRRRGGHPTE